MVSDAPFRIIANTFLRHLKTVLIAAALIGAATFSLLVLAPTTQKGVTVLVASSDIAGGTSLSLESAQVVVLPGSAVPKGTLTSLDELEGATAVSDIAAKTVLTTALTDTNSVVPTGYSRITLTLLTDVPQVSAGERVDVWGASPNCFDTPCAVELISTGALVRSIDVSEQTLLGSGTQKTMTLLVSSPTIPHVLHANSTGNIHFVVSAQSGA